MLRNGDSPCSLKLKLQTFLVGKCISWWFLNYQLLCQLPRQLFYNASLPIVIYFSIFLCRFQPLTVHWLAVSLLLMCVSIAEEGLSLFVGPGGSTALGSQHTRWVWCNCWLWLPRTRHLLQIQIHFKYTKCRVCLWTTSLVNMPCVSKEFMLRYFQFHGI